MKGSDVGRATSRSAKKELQRDCAMCPWRSQDFFCSLPEMSLAALNALTITNLVTAGTTLFSEGEAAHGVYIVCSGRIKLTAYSSDGRAIVFRVAGPGEVLALSACVLGDAFEATAQAIETAQVNYVDRLPFLELLKTNSDAAFNAIRELSRNYQKAYAQVRSLALSASVAEKLAKLLLQWCDAAITPVEVGVPFTHTHEEIAEMIGTSRETVTRALTDLRNRKLIRLDGATLQIPDRTRLEAAVGSRHRSRRKARRLKKA